MRHRNKTLRPAPILARLALVAVCLVLTPAVEANGHGVTVYLGYLPEVSTWGPYEATGQAAVNVGEGRAQVTVDHMIADPAIHYEVWLVRADDRNALHSLGTFQVDSSGHAEVELVNPNLEPAEYRFVVITAEPADDSDPRPGPRRTIAGVFPNTQARILSQGSVGLDEVGSETSANPVGSEGQGSSEGGAGVSTLDAVPASPSRLPVTGGNMPDMALGAVLTGAGFVASIGLIVAGGRRQRAATRAQRNHLQGGAP